jgi:enoyl-[acyl-carrier-protein] reductase (NADH)
VPNYKVMGAAKASLESSARVLAAELVRLDNTYNPVDRIDRSVG